MLTLGLALLGFLFYPAASDAAAATNTAAKVLGRIHDIRNRLKSTNAIVKKQRLSVVKLKERAIANRLAGRTRRFPRTPFKKQKSGSAVSAVRTGVTVTDISFRASTIQCPSLLTAPNIAGLNLSYARFASIMPLDRVSYKSQTWMTKILDQMQVNFECHSQGG